MPLCYVMPRVLLCAVKVSALILIMFCHAIGAVMPLCAVKPLVLLCHSVKLFNKSKKGIFSYI
jgi:hypothetical protein